jgi:two-component system sensor kinase FixL
MLANSRAALNPAVYLGCQGYCVHSGVPRKTIMRLMFSGDTQALMEAAVDAIIVINDQGRIAAANQATHHMFGYRADELLGQNVSMLMPAPHREAHDQHLANYLRTGVARIIGIGRNVTALRKNGTPFPAHLSVGRIADASPARFVGILRDISSEQEAMAELQLQRDRANAYLELNDAILLMLDEQRRIVEINTRGSDILGAARIDMHGRDWLDFIRGDVERERALRLLQSSLAKGSERERELDALTVVGERRRIHWRCIARRSADGSPAGWLCSGQDVTERERHAEQALLTQERLTRVAGFATMGELAAGVAHELNQPLTAITTYARACERYLVMDQPDFPAVQEAVREIAAEGLRAGEIIRRLRQLVRADPLERRPTDINALLEELMGMISAGARVHDTQLRFVLSPRLPLVLADPVQIQQVVLNLVRNAFEALAANPPQARELDIVSAVTADVVEVRVCDNGPGVAPAMANKLFDAFSTTKQNGTGLGLAMSRTLIESHKGIIGTRPGAAGGAVFFIGLPALTEGVS